MSNRKTQDDGVVDAKQETGTAAEVATTDTNAVSAQTNVKGISLRFPFARVGQALSQWRCDGKPPTMGAFYIGKDKSTNVFLANGGRTEGINAILLDVVPGIMEDKPFTGNANPPKRWVGATCVEDAAAEGFSLELKETGEVWPDTKRPRLRANASRFCYLQMLVPVPEDFDSVDFQMFPIGDKLYTPARVEYSKGAFKSLAEVIGNIQRMETFHHRKESGYKFTWCGKVVHVFTEDAVSKQTGATYPILRFGLAMENGKSVELANEAKEDFVGFLAAVKDTVADVNDAENSEF